MKSFLAFPMMALLAACGPTCKSDQLKEGLDEQQLMALCGEPDHANRTSRHMMDQFVYGGTEDIYVYLDHGIVRSWQYRDNPKISH